MKILVFIFLITILVRYLSHLDKMSKLEKMANEPSKSEKNNFIKNFFNKKIDYTCLPYEPEDKSICKINPARRCVIDNHSACFITPDDEVNAYKYAFRKLCIDKGHCLAEHEDGSITCEFSKETCLAASKNKKDLNNEFFEDEIESTRTTLTNPEGAAYTQAEIEKNIKEKKKSFYYGKHYWIDDVGCVDGSVSGIAAFQNYCETPHACNMGSWNFDEKTFKCTITRGYCNKMKMDYRNGMCVPRNATLEKIAGKFITRGLPCPPYANLWGGGIRNSGDHATKIMKDHCYVHLKEPDQVFT